MVPMERGLLLSHHEVEKLFDPTMVSWGRPYKRTVLGDFNLDEAVVGDRREEMGCVPPGKDGDGMVQGVGHAGS